MDNANRNSKKYKRFRSSFEPEIFDGIVGDEASLSEFVDLKVQENVGYARDTSKIVDELKEWAENYSIPNNALDELLKILKKSFLPSLPDNSETFLNESSDSALGATVASSNAGKFFYFGLKNKLTSSINVESHKSSKLELIIFMDGISQYNSSAKQYWPILCKVIHEDDIYEPFTVAIYAGEEKPNKNENFTAELIPEINQLHADGLVINNRKFEVIVKFFVCDSPSTLFLKSSVNHLLKHAEESPEPIIKLEPTDYLDFNVIQESDTPKGIQDKRLKNATQRKALFQSLATFKSNLSFETNEPSTSTNDLSKYLGGFESTLLGELSKIDKRLLRLEKGQCDLRKGQSELTSFVVDENYKNNTTMCQTSFSQKYRVPLPIDEIDHFIKLNKLLGTSFELKQDVTSLLAQCIDKNFIETKTIVKMLKTFITKNVATQYTASRKATEIKTTPSESERRIFKETFFFKIMKEIIIQQRSSRSLPVDDKSLSKALSDVLCNARNWRE